VAYAVSADNLSGGAFPAVVVDGAPPVRTEPVLWWCRPSTAAPTSARRLGLRWPIAPPRS